MHDRHHDHDEPPAPFTVDEYDVKGDRPMTTYPDHAPMRGDDLDRESHDGCDICHWQREGLAVPFVPQRRVAPLCPSCMINPHLPHVPGCPTPVRF